MAITKIQAGALPAGVVTVDAIADTSITHAKLHTDMDLSAKTVTLPTLTALDVTNNIVVGGTVDGIDIAARDAVLTSTTATAGAALPLAGGTMTGGLIVQTATGQLRLQGTSNTNKNVSIFYNESADYGQINVDESGVNQKDLWVTGLNLKFGRSTSSESMRIDSSGDMFLGTSSDIAPANGTNLYISDGTISRLGLEKTGANARKFSINNGGTYFSVYDETADAERMRISSSGNVSIGTAGDIDKLTVQTSSSALHATTLTKGTNTPGIWVTTDNNDNNMSGIHLASGGGTHFSSIVGARTANTSHWGTHLAFYTHTNDTSAINTATEKMRINGNGQVTMPYQPIASLSDTREVTISNAELTSANFYNHTWVNQGNHFNASTGRFTCPVDGIYRIYFRATGTGNTNVRLKKNTGTINEAYESTGTNHSVSSEAVIPCSANDYLHIQIANLSVLGGTQHKQVTFELMS